MEACNEQKGGWGDLLREGRGPLAALLLLGVWLNAADALVSVALMPSVAKSIGGYAYFAWATGAFMLGSIVACASGGYLAGRLGLKRGLAVSGLIYAAGCVLSAAAPGIAAFLIGRLVQGMGGGWILALVFVAIGVVFPERLSARLFSALAGVWGAATLFGPLVGGGFATLGLWRWAFWAFGVQALLFVLGVVVWLKADAKPQTAPAGAPWLQLVLVGLGVGGLAAAAVLRDVLAVSCALGGLAILAGVVAVDRRARVRILPLASTDLTRATGLGYAAIFLLSAASAIHTIYSPVLLQRIGGASPLAAGYAVACEAVGWSAVALAVGGVGESRQPALIRIGGVLTVVGLAIIAAVVGSGALWAVAAGATVMGAGFGAAFAFITARVVEGLEGDERALASAAVPTLQYVGGAVGAALAGIMAAALGLGRPFDAATASRAALPLFAVFIPLMTAGAFAAWRLADRAPRADLR